MEGQFVKGNETKRPTQRTNEYTAVVSGEGGINLQKFVSLSVPLSFLLRASVPRLITQRHSAYPTNNLS